MSERAAEIAGYLRGCERWLRVVEWDSPSTEAVASNYRTKLAEAADLLSSLPPVRGESVVAEHRCSGCGHRWNGLAVESGRTATGAELCGDCWRTAQPVLHGPPVRAEQETAEPTKWTDGPYANSPSRFDCLECMMRGIAVDEDGCCKSCGHDAERIGLCKTLHVTAPVRAGAAKTITPHTVNPLNGFTAADRPASPVREAEPTPQPRQAAQYRPGGVFMFNTTTRAMENCENELFVKASELDKAEAQWIRIAAEDVSDAKSAGLREAEPKSDDASLRTVVAHPFFALARAFNWDDNQLTAARQLIDITVIRLDEMQAAQQAEIADLRNQNEIMKNADYSFVGTAAEQARIQADADRYRVALEAIRSLDFQKTPNGCDDFYSGAPQFVKAWTLANDALQGPCASPVREAEPRRDVDVALSSLSAARLLLTNGDHADALEELNKGIAQVKPLLLAGLREAEPLKALVAEAVELLKHVRVLDCGAHYCRYCPAKSPEWEHTPSCPYEESQVVSERARVLRQKLSAALEGANNDKA